MGSTSDENLRHRGCVMVSMYSVCGKDEETFTPLLTMSTSRYLSLDLGEGHPMGFVRKSWVDTQPTPYP